MDRLGERLIAEVRPADSDLQLLHELLASYGKVLDAAVEQVQSDLRLAPSFRVKNTGTILEKLRRQSGSGLRNMQDIAGMRIVDDWTLREQDAVADELVREFSDEERAPRVSDRREHPSHGYRAVHVVVFPDHVPIEIQVRTRRQHEWAEVFEKLADALGRGIRYGEPPTGLADVALAESIVQVAIRVSDAVYRIETDLDAGRHVGESGLEVAAMADQALKNLQELLELLPAD